MNTYQLIDVPEVRAELARRAWPLWRLAASLGVAQTTLSAYFNGRIRAPSDLRERIEQALGLRPGELAPKRLVLPHQPHHE